MSYSERPPSPRLAPWVHCIWTFQDPAPGAGPDRIVPDGRPELVIHRGDPFDEVDARGAVTPQPRALFTGQLTRPLHLRCPGNAHVIGVRFRPAGARAYFQQSMRLATDRRLPQDGLEALADAEAVEDHVAARIAAAEWRPDVLVEEVAARIERQAGQVDTAELVREAGVGQRQLERRFSEAVGVGPALLADIFRFRSVFDLLEHDAARPWTDAAMAAGYFDQSHFIRKFRRFVGCAPSAFQRSRGALAAALVEA